MKSALSDTLVICDMDNTLLTAKEGLPACNRTVINLFTSLGGLFTVATGRPPESIRAALEGIRLSLPAISCNGALLYDFSTETVLHRSTLDREQATVAIKDILAKFPRMGVEVMAGNGEMYVIHANETTHAHQVDEHLGSIACQLKTGRTHQIRVHMASIGHPLAGDAVYGPRSCIKSLNGQCLHAKELGFIHPATQQWVQFDSPLPAYFTEFLTRLRKEHRA